MSFVARLKDTRLLILAPVILALCCFINTLNYAFVYDDRFQIVEAAPILADWQPDNLKRIFDRDIWGFFKQSFSWQGKIHSQYYRPVFALFVMVNYKYASLDARYWHLTALILHLLAILLAYQLLIESQRFALNREQFDIHQAHKIAAIATLCFAIHPAQSESVAWVAAYVNSLSAIFIFSTIIAYLRARGEKFNFAWLSIAITTFALAILTKESSIIVPLLIAAYELFINKLPLRGRIKSTILCFIPFVIITVGYIALRITILGAFRLAAVSTEFPELSKLSLLVNIYTVPTMVIKYLQILILPFWLNPMYGVRYIISPSLQNFFLPLLLIVITVVIALAVARTNIMVRIALLLFSLPLLPVLDIRSFKPEDLVHDRYLYISLLGAGMLLALIGHELQQQLRARQYKGPAIAIVSAAILMLLSATTIKQNQVWANEWQLWSAAEESVPDSCTVNLELGRLNDEAEQLIEAKSFYEKAKTSCPNSVTLYYKLGLLYGRLGDLNNSEASFKQMAELATYPYLRATAFLNLGLIYEKRGELTAAIKCYKQGIELNPTSKNVPQVQQVIEELTTRLAQQTKP